MAERRLDQQTKDVVKTAWASLLQRYQTDTATDEYHWTDNEGDVGFLKDVDALNALIEPFLLSPNSFVDPALKLEDLASRVEKLLQQVHTQSINEEADTEVDSLSRYLGFSAAPYPYIQLELDFIDSASAVLRLICNVANLYAFQKQPIQKPLEKLMTNVARTAVDFLLSARIEDKSGVRWSGFSKRVDTAGKYANLFFTNCAALALHNSLETPGVKNWIGQRREQIESTLRRVIAWVTTQYDPATNGFWMDEARTQTQVMGVLYALEVLYTIAETLPEEVRENCARSLTAVVEKMTETTKASALQRDFYHILPLPSGLGNTFYDDRKYIGAFLSLFTLAKAKDPNIVTEAFIQAGNVLYAGVSDEWIDDPSNLWDDGRPLICFSQDALIGLVNFAIEGKVDTINLGEFDLRFAIRDTLKSDEVVEAIFSVLLDKARSRRDKELTSKINKVASASEGRR
jgi:hypothetical protein